MTWIGVVIGIVVVLPVLCALALSGRIARDEEENEARILDALRNRKKELF